jgi:hypothetical protein
MIWLFVGLGIAALAAAFALTQVSKGLPKTWRITQGTVTASEGWEADMNYTKVPAARVRFTYEVDGIPYAGDQRWAHGPVPPQTGAKVTVYYDPFKPGKGSVAPFAPSSGLVTLTYFLMIVGFAMFTVAISLGITRC